ncbi:DUF1929-domain-containing protein [Clavulina sp. PMI_390]|nr:DUF1929-domain-containing protein [Clavulina sp. PMI_390]
MFATALLSSLSYALSVAAQATPTTLSAPGQPTQTGTPLTFSQYVNSGVSAQQLYLGTEDTIYVVDKTEGNPMTVAGHPAWASEINLVTGKVRAMDVKTNSFCAGGNFLGDGRILNVGGNQAITTGGNAPAGSQPASFGGDPYEDYDGGNAVRILTPCTNGTCQWSDKSANYMTSRRWYPTLETLADGSMFIIGGDMMGGYVNDDTQNNPTYEFFPSTGGPYDSQLLQDTLPANLYPLTWLMPSGNLFIQANWATELLNLVTGKETPLPNVPHAVRTYPASAATVMLPLTVANNYTATILMCGGSNINDWNPNDNVIIDIAASKSCVRIAPDGDQTWHDDTSLPEGRTMGNFIILPDATLFLLNGGGMGTAGYGTQDWVIDESYATDPITAPLIYYPTNRTFTRAGLANSTINRLYHSSALLLADGAVFVAGSNPHADYAPDATYPTEYRTEMFYPWYYFERRPEPAGLLSVLSYGGSYFNVTLSNDDMNGDPTTYAPQTTAVLIRTGYSTHGLQMGQRYLELNSTYTINLDGTVTLHVSQLPTNANLFTPGPSMIHIVVAGVPSVGKMIMVGSGVIETQTLNAVVPLPPSGVEQNTTSSNNGTGNGNGGGPGNHAGAATLTKDLRVGGLAGGMLALVGLMMMTMA